MADMPSGLGLANAFEEVVIPAMVKLSETELAAAKKEIAQSAGWFVGIGVLSAILGVMAIAFPLFSTIATAIWIGWMFLISGVLMLFHALFAWRWPASVWNLLIALLYIGAGAWILYAPLAGVMSLTLVIAALFLAEGVSETVIAFRLRPLDGWGSMLFSGLAAMAAGILIAYELPSSAAWALGLLLGLNLLSTGLSFVLLAFACRQGAAATGGQGEFGRADLRAS